MKSNNSLCMVGGGLSYFCGCLKTLYKDVVC